MIKKCSRAAFFLYFTIFIILFCIFLSAFIYASPFLKNAEHEIDASVNSNSRSLPIVVIDAGHGGEDGGASGADGTLEKDLNLQIAKKLQRTLSSMGVECVLTRNEDILLYDRNTDYQGRKKMLDMLERLKICRSYENAIFISIHQNSFPQPQYSGFQIYYSENSSESFKIAEMLEQAIKLSLQPNNNRHSKASGGTIYLLDRLECPALLLECGFLSNPDECALLSTEEYQNKLCALIASTICEYLKG